MKQFLANIFSLLFAVFAFVFLFVFMQAHHLWGNIHIKQLLINLNKAIDVSSTKLMLGFVISIVLGIVTAFAFSIVVKTNKRLLIFSALIYLFVFLKTGLFLALFE